MIPVPPSASPGVPAPAQISATIADYMARHRGDRVSIGDLVAALGERAYGALLLVFAAPNLPPIGVPGVSSICAVPLVVLALQMLRGRAQPSLPQWVQRRSVSADAFARVMRVVIPFLARVERLLVPRWRRLTDGGGRRVIGAVCVALAAVLMLPIPFGNLLPAAAIALLALGLTARDGRAVAVGLTLTLVALAVVAGVAAGSVGVLVWAWETVG